MKEKTLLDKFMEWENTDDLARICENRAFDIFEGGYLLARKEMIQEIERRLKNIPNFYGSSFDDQDMGSEAALESLLSWITEKGTDKDGR